MLSVNSENCLLAVPALVCPGAFTITTTRFPNCNPSPLFPGGRTIGMPATDGGKLHAFPIYDELEKIKVAANLKRNLPQPLRQLRNFVVFKYSPPQRAGGKRGKVPYYAHNVVLRPRSGTQGSPRDLSYMATFERAMQVYLEHKDIAGIGICALPDNPYCFLDIDNCFDPKTGELNDVANELLQLGTYTEFSPGGRGLRLVLDGSLGIDAKHLEIGLELFSCKGFLTLTGMPFGKPKAIAAPTDQQWHRLQELLGAKHAPHAGSATEADQRNIPSPLTKARLPDVKRALKALDPDLPYPDWLLVGQALHSGAPDVTGTGFKLWLAWSRKGDKFADTSEDELEAKWSSFGPGRGVTLNSLFHLAQQHGFDAKPRLFDDAPTPDIVIDGFVSGQSEPDRQLDPVCHGLFDHIGAYMFIGRAKIGKSRVLGLMTASALCGGKCFDFQFTSECRVLAIALEERAEDVIERMKLYMIEPTDYKDQLMVIDHDAFLVQAKKYSEEYNYLQWLDAALTQFKPRFVYLDPLVNMRMVWQNAPESSTKRITEEDYTMAAEMQQLAVKHQCALLFTLHGSKRKHIPQGASFDPFESVGTTSWTAAGCTGSLVIMDKPGHNPLEEDDDGQRVFSVRSRFRRAGDEHLLLQNGKHGMISSLGPYRAVLLTQRQQEILEIIEDAMDDGQDWITGATIARAAGISQRAVWGLMARIQEGDGMYNGRRIEATRHRGYRLVTP